MISVLVVRIGLSLLIVGAAALVLYCIWGVVP